MAIETKVKRDYRITVRLSEKSIMFIEKKVKEYNKKNKVSNTSKADIIESLIDYFEVIKM